MKAAVFSAHKDDRKSFEEANHSFEHELVYFTASLEAATASTRRAWMLGRPNGAAARLGMKRSLLSWRMKKLGIPRSP